MAEYLVIGGKNDEAALHALAVGADIAAKMNAQVDIAVAPAAAAVARLGKTPRRVVEVHITAPSVPGISLDAMKQAPSGGWKGVMSFARAAAKTAAGAAKQQFGQYRELADELRLVRYDVVVDISGDAVGLLAARIADTPKVLGFATENIPDAAPGASLLYHDSRAVPSNLPRREQCRRLAAAGFGYTLQPRPEWNFIDSPPPAGLPEVPFILIGGGIPAPFMEILCVSGLPLFTPETPADMLAAARRASCAVGNGIAIAIAAAAGAHTLFIGGAAHTPPEAATTESPTALKNAIDEVLQRAAAEKSAATPSPVPNLTPRQSAAESPDAAAAESVAEKESAPPEESSSGGGGLRLKD